MVVFRAFLLVAAMIAASATGHLLAHVQNAEVAPANYKDAVIERLQELRVQVDELRWEIDDLKLRNRSPEELAEAMRASKDHPESAVVVSADYPKWRLPYGVKIDDQRPPEVIDAAIARCKAGKGIAYMWLSIDKIDGQELRVYMTKIGYKDPKAKPAK